VGINLSARTKVNDYGDNLNPYMSSNLFYSFLILIESDLLVNSYVKLLKITVKVYVLSLLVKLKI
jgi:hypothetical protein